MSQPIPGPLVFETGRSSTNAREIFAGLPVGLELLMTYSVLFDDFNRVALDSNTVHRWTVISDTGCSAAILADTENGYVRLLSDSGDNEGSSIQGNEVFKLNSGKKLLFEARVKTADADDVDLAVGLAENFATDPEAMILGAGCWFQINEASASILAKAGTAGAASEDTGVDAADNTAVTLSMLYDGTDLHYYVDRSKKVTISAASLPTGELTPCAYFIAGAAAADFLDIDYILVASER